MQKKLIAIAVAAAMVPAVAMADTTVYGRIHTSLDHITGAENTWSFNSSSSRFGAKGDEDLGGGLKAIYKIESGITSVGGGTADGNGNGVGGGAGHLFTNQRDTWVGVSGSFGTIKIGRQGVANQWIYDSNYFGDQIGDVGGFTNANAPGRSNGTFTYETNNMSGIGARLTIIPAANRTSATTTDVSTSWGVKVDYSAGGVGVNFGYFNIDNGTTEEKPMMVAGSFDFGTGAASIQYVRSKTNDVSRGIWNVGGKFNVGNGAIKAQYTKANDKAGVNDGGSMFAVGYDHSLSKRTTAYAAYAKVSNDDTGAWPVNNWGHGGTTGGGNDPAGISFGLTHNF